MDYKNLFQRSFISFIIILLYIFLYVYIPQYIIFFIFSLYLIIIIEILFFFKKLKLFFLIYIILSLIIFFNLDFNDLNFFIKFNYLILIIVSFDTFSYLFGSFFGKYKIMKKISPNKTLEGTIGGFLFSLILTYLYSSYFDINYNPFLLFMTIILVISCFLGDIIESYFKRKNNLKNSSNFLPGHGGFLDRFDSFIFSIMIFTVTYNYIL